MNKKAGFSIIAAIIVLGGFYAFFQNHQMAATPAQDVSSKTGTGPFKAGDTSLPGQPAVTEEKDEPKKIFSAGEISALKQRNQEISNQMDGLTKALDEQLENAEQRKTIEARYLELTKEQNQLAIQLVKANQQDATVE